MKILPGRVRREGKGRAIRYYKKDRCQKTACDEPIGREPFGRELRVERLPSACSGPEAVEDNRVEFRGQINVSVEHPRQL
jgi:hypothetical protein